MTHLSLFSGIGGLDLAAEWAGFETVGQCEWADYPTKVLEKHWPDVPRWRDIRTLTGEDFYAKTGLRTVYVISGGFPCQPFSVAGKRGGKDDDRYLWPEMLRVIRELKPLAVVGENVPGIVSLEIDQVLADLECEGYACQAFIVPAAGVGAWHKRERVAIVAYAIDWSGALRRHREFPTDQKNGKKRHTDGAGSTGVIKQQRKCQPGLGGVADGLRTVVDVANTDAESNRLQGGCGQTVLVERERVPQQSDGVCGGPALGDFWKTEPCVGRVADGVPHRVDRIRCLGNAVVPQQFYPFFAALAEHIMEG